MRAEKFYKDCVNELGQALAEAEQRNKALKLAAYENGFDAYSPGRASHPSTPQEIALHGDRDPLTPVIGSAQRSASASGRRSDTGVAALAMMRMSMGEPASSSSEPRPTRESAPPRVNRAPRGTTDKTLGSCVIREPLLRALGSRAGHTTTAISPQTVKRTRVPRGTGGCCTALPAGAGGSARRVRPRDPMGQCLPRN